MDIDRSDRRNHGIHLEYLTLDSLIKGSSVALMDDCIRLFRIKIIRPFQKKKKEKFAAKKCATYPTKKKNLSSSYDHHPNLESLISFSSVISFSLPTLP